MARQPGRGSRTATERAAAATEVRQTVPGAGTLLDGRYRLSRELPGPGRRWSAIDEVLDRPVEIRFVDATPAELSDLVASAADRYDGRWLRLLDGGVDGEVSWVVIEDPCRPSLADRLADGPIDADQAVGLALAVAHALADAGPAGEAAALTPDRVYVDQNGVRMDAMVEQPLDRVAGRPGPAGEAAAVRAVGQLLLFALTGVWAGRAVPGLPGPAPSPDAAPRRFRGGVPRRVDAVTRRAGSGEITRLAELIAALEAIPRARPSDEPRPGVRTAQRIATWVLPPAGLAVVGLVAWIIGSNLGAVPGADQTNPPVQPLPAAHHHSALVWHQPPRVRSFDPAGDGSEDPSGARLAVDGNPATTWTTDVYRTADFGGLKSGVGLVLDLGHRRKVGAVTIQLTTPGARLQLRAGDHAPKSAGSLAPVPGASRLTAHHQRLSVTLHRPETARYWLVWLTRLPATGEGYAEGIREIRLERPGGR